MMRAVACRALTLLFAVAQFALPGVLSVADGIDANGGRDAAAHVEDGAHKQCKPPHTSDCAVCRYLATGMVGNSPAPIAVPAVLRVQFEATAVAAPLSSVGFGLHSRAPPTALG